MAEKEEREVIQRIEIEFALPVELTDEEYQALDRIVGHVCKRSCPEGWAFWPAGYGSKPQWSRADALFLGKEAEPNAPASGEPTFDDSIYHIECAARELYPEEIDRRKQKAAAVANRKAQWDARLADWLHKRGMRRASWWVADLSFWMRRRWKLIRPAQNPIP